MSKRQRKLLHKKRSMKKIARMIGTAAAAVPLAIAVPVMVHANESGPVASLPSLSQLMATTYADQLVAGKRFSVDLRSVFGDGVTTYKFDNVVVQNSSVADAEIIREDGIPLLYLSLKKTGTTSIDVQYRQNGQETTSHERFQIKVDPNTAIDTNNNGVDIGDVVRYFKTNSDGFTTSDYRTLLKAAVASSVSEPNHAPSVFPEITPIAMTAGTYSEIQLNDLFSDEDGDELSFTLIDPPSSGSFVGAYLYSETSTLVLYAVSPGSQPLRFSVDGSDGEASATKVFSVTVDAAPVVNHPPVADAISFEVNEDGSYVGTFSGTDVDATDTLTYSVVSQPSHGTVSYSSLELNQFRYTPAADFSGTDAFTYVANDGTADSVPVTVSITIKPVNDKPVANAISFEVDEDGSYIGTFNGSDVDAADILTYSFDSQPSHGTVSYNSLELNQFRYTPAANYNGTDSFTYVANDGTVDSLPVTVSITVNPVNDKPVANAISFEVDEDGSYIGTFNGTDVDAADILSYHAASQPLHGTLSYGSLALNQFRYTPEADYNGGDSFTYIANDGTVDSETATVTIIVNSVNERPVANAIYFEMEEDGSYIGTFSGTDADAADILTFRAATEPLHGTLSYDSLELNQFRYTPAANYNGPDSFTYVANDGTEDSGEVTVTLNIAPVNDLPIAGMVGQEGLIHLHSNQSAMLDLTKVFTDVDGQQLTFRTSFQGNGYSLNGTLSGSSLYLNALSSSGFSSFDLQASDDGGETWVSLPSPVLVEVDNEPYGSLPDVEGISNAQDEYTVDLANYFEGDFGHYFSYITEPPYDGLQIEGSTLTVPLEDDKNVNVVVSAWDDHGLTITDNFNLYVGLGVEDIGVQFFDNYDVNHNAYIYMKDIFPNADEFRVTVYNNDEVKSIGSYELGTWTSDDYLSLWTDASFTNVSEVQVEGRTLDNEGQETNVKSYTLRIRENTAPYLEDGGVEAPPIYIKKGDTVELGITDAEGDPITSVDVQPDDSICGESGSCVTTTYANGKLIVTGLEAGSKSMEITMSDGLPFGTGYVYRYFIVYDDSIDIVDDFSIDKDLAGLLTGMNLSTLQLQHVDSEYIIPEATLEGTTLHFDVNSEAMYPGDSELITVYITDGEITRTLTLYMNVAFPEIPEQGTE
ncbi:hypothetical protein A8990_1642 [Paenibacillus taihuensis]|uniref:Tandem-95 repeat protein n=1 Tax=Paenibacillus taihuensis TaxID=1156355 RepID=A0A3D9Q0Y4_9BACL|nr:Ig-like domain-containing protein [Paenibacillus taihuensis]REE56311.1 hypothetical protein A8990_1642 [Paenibacillus taihuensis]